VILAQVIRAYRQRRKIQKTLLVVGSKDMKLADTART
jgi:hypothetical protein